jgi:nucleotide-binding universal stress UspA family protein
MKIETILVPVDFSDVTAEVVRYATEMAKSYGGRIVLLHISEPEPDFVGYEAGPQAVRTTVARDFRSEHQQLDQLKHSITGAGLEVLALHIQGSLAEKIVQEAQAHQAGLIVVGTHGHGSFYNLLVGSVTASLLKHAPCPVMVVPALHRAPAAPVVD